MKKNALIGLLVAVGGSVIALSTAYGLYLVKPDDKTISIGINTSADVNLAISDVADATSTVSLSKTNAKQYTFTLSGGTTTGTTYTQDTAIGDLEVKITSTNSTLINKLAGTVTLGYTASTFYAAETYSLATGAVSGSDFVITKTNVPFKLAGLGATLDLSLASGTTDAEAVTLGGASYTVTINWKQNSTFEYAYVVGTMTSWGETDEYRMVPALDTADFTWVYDNDANITAGNSFKCKKGTQYSGGNNYEVTTGYKVTKITWLGGTDALVASSVSA